MALFQQSERHPDDGELPLCVLGPGGDFRIALTGRGARRTDSQTDKGRRNSALARMDAALQELGHVSRFAAQVVAAAWIRPDARERTAKDDWPLVVLGPEAWRPCGTRR